jgi:uncharacterized protein
MSSSAYMGISRNRPRLPQFLCQDDRVNSAPYLRGILLFNKADFFAAHEVLEDVWREAPEPQRKFLQGLIQTAVAFHHYSRNNQIGARSLLKRALHNLEKYPDEFGGLKLLPFRVSIADWLECLDKEATVPPLPTLTSCH